MHTLILDKHTGERYGHVFHSHTLTDYELLELAGVSNETDDIAWPPEEYEFVRLSDTAYMALESSAAATLGRAGGSVTSDAKAAASRENGKRGGRPRKG